MEQKSILNSMKFPSPLAGTSALKARRRKAGRNLAMSLSLTSLVDALAILLIYLLTTGTGGVQNVDISPGIHLPSASQTAPFENDTVIRVEKGKYYLNDQEVRLSELATRLAATQESLKENDSQDRPKLIIQADRETDYAALDPIIRASSEVGFYIIKFAVLHEERM